MRARRGKSDALRVVRMSIANRRAVLLELRSCVSQTNLVMKGHEDGGMFFGQEEKSVSYFCRHDP